MYILAQEEFWLKSAKEVVEGESYERYAFLLPVLADSIACPTDGQPPHHDQTGRRVCVPTWWPYATYAPDSLGFFYAQVGSTSVGIPQVLLHLGAR